MEDSEKKEIRKVRYQIRSLTRQAKKLNEDMDKLIQSFKNMESK